VPEGPPKDAVTVVAVAAVVPVAAVLMRCLSVYVGHRRWNHV
jgi:hypothetical protein